MTGSAAPLTKARLTGAVLAVGLGVLLTGCGSAGPGGGEVASVVSIIPPQPDASAATPTAPQRPLVRAGTSPPDADRPLEVWRGCYREYGLDPGEPPRTGSAGEGEAQRDPAQPATRSEADKACAAKRPR